MDNGQETAGGNKVTDLSLAMGSRIGLGKQVKFRVIFGRSRSILGDGCC